MHDLIHDLARHVAKDHDIKIVSDIENTQEANKNYCRYISIYGLKAPTDHSEIDVVDRKVRAISLYSDNVKLKDKSFSHARSLRVLEAEGLEINLLNKLKQLRYFSASHIPREISLPNLQFLHLVGAQFEALPESICNFKTLLTLDFSSCQNLETLPELICNLEKLSHLDLSHCSKLEKLPESIDNLKSLQYLNFSSCENLKTVPESIGNLQKLSHFDLSWCYKLRRIPESFGNLKSLQHLNLTYCSNITTLPESIGNLQKLLHIDLSSCSRLHNLPGCFGNIESLQYLNLSYCVNLWKLSECFGNLKSLQYLILSNCTNIETLPESFVNLQNLLHLSLNRCYKLVKLPERFSNLKSLERLELHTIDQVQEYLPGLLIDLTNLRHLSVSDTQRPLSTSSMKLIRRLTKFETLRLDIDFTIKEEEEDTEKGKCCSIVCLENLNMLQGDLTLRGLDKMKDPKDAERVNLKQKHKVRELQLIWNGDELDYDDVDNDHDAVVLQNLQPSPELQRLTISGYGGRQLPNCMIDHLYNLKLEKIPRLEKIKFGSQFRSLKEFYTKDMEKLEQVSLMNNDVNIIKLIIEECPCMMQISLPPSTTKLTLKGNVGLLLSPAATIQASSLQTLHVFNCQQLASLPECIGKLSSLKVISITGSPNIQSLPNSMRQLELERLSISCCSVAFKEDCDDPKSNNWSRIQNICEVDISTGHW